MRVARLHVAPGEGVLFLAGQERMPGDLRHVALQGIGAGRSCSTGTGELEFADSSGSSSVQHFRGEHLGLDDLGLERLGLRSRLRGLLLLRLVAGPGLGVLARGPRFLPGGASGYAGCFSAVGFVALRLVAIVLPGRRGAIQANFLRCNEGSEAALPATFAATTPLESKRRHMNDYVSDHASGAAPLRRAARGIAERGYTQPTPVQSRRARSPSSRGKDLIVRSKTGTGKTAAFGIPLLERIPAGTRKVRPSSSAPRASWRCRSAQEIEAPRQVQGT